MNARADSDQLANNKMLSLPRVIAIPMGQVGEFMAKHREPMVYATCECPIGAFALPKRYINYSVIKFQCPVCGSVLVYKNGIVKMETVGEVDKAWQMFMSYQDETKSEGDCE